MKKSNGQTNDAQSIIDASEAGTTGINFPAPQQPAANELTTNSTQAANAIARVASLMQYFPNVTALVNTDSFTLHDWILVLIEQYRREYDKIVSLRCTGDHKMDQFLVHSDLSIALANSGLVVKRGNIEKSPNVFGGFSQCCKFQKIDPESSAK